MNASPGQPTISVVIVTYNSAHVICDALDSVTRCLPEAPVILVDNGSTDSTVEAAAPRQGVTVFQGHGNIGFGAAVNLGVRAARTPLVLAVNPDTIITGVDRFELARLARCAHFGLAACTVERGGEVEEAMKAAWGWRRELLWCLWTFYLKPHWLSGRRPAAKEGEAAWIGGAAFVADRSEWATVGGFDEEIFLYYEDFDISRRYQAMGLPLRATDAILVTHARQEDMRGVGVHVVASWVFRSLIQLAATRRGPRAGRELAVATVLALRAIEWVAVAMTWVPGIAPDGARKATSAREAREYLLAEPAATGVDNHYRDANAVLAALSRRVRS